jgi:hypothetical protein
VGCSSYKVDIAIEHPSNPNKFIAGIECDGFSYFGAKTARDRDHLRKSVLEAMGWNMYRVWSPEWISNPDVEQDKLLRFIASALSESSESNKSEDQVEPLEIEEAPVPAEPLSIEELYDVVKRMPSAALANRTSSNPYGFAYYTEASWSEAAVDLFANTDSERIKAMIRHIVEVEQPIHQDLLYMRMAPAFGNQKATKAVRGHVDSVLRSMRSVIRGRDNFYTIQGFNNHRVRIARPDEPSRKVNFIAPVELDMAMMAVAKRAFGPSKEVLIDETAKALGYSRKGAEIMRCLSATFERLLKSGSISVNADGKVNVVKEV